MAAQRRYLFDEATAPKLNPYVVADLETRLPLADYIEFTENTRTLTEHILGDQHPDTIRARANLAEMKRRSWEDE